MAWHDFNVRPWEWQRLTLNQHRTLVEACRRTVTEAALQQVKEARRG